MAVDARVTIERMAEAAKALLASLGPEQCTRASLPFEVEGDRVRWHYTPMVQSGLTLLEMDARQRQLAFGLAATGVSVGGFATVSAIIGLENTLDMREGFRSRFWDGVAGATRGRDPNMYFTTIFGEPGSEAWGWRFGGHHVSINHTIRGGRLAGTPAFFGADPADSPGIGQMLRPLGPEEDLGRELLHLLSAEQRALAVVAKAAPLDMVQGNRPRVEEGVLPIPLWELMAPMPEANAERLRTMSERRAAEIGLGAGELEAVRYFGARPAGLRAAAMDGGQREALRALIGQYTLRLPDEVASAEAARVAAAFEEVHFCWAGGLERGEPHYYRLQGPRFLVEYDNVQNGANHIHSVWRDPEGDFGRDVLAEHYAAAH